MPLQFPERSNKETYSVFVDNLALHARVEHDFEVCDIGEGAYDEVNSGGDLEGIEERGSFGLETDGVDFG